MDTLYVFSKLASFVSARDMNASISFTSGVYNRDKETDGTEEK